ncbi:S41 family peptidase [bacterium SCSIO 12741]|nr:S41 family peptidase [bacterium SCSIO 12741]
MGINRSNAIWPIVISLFFVGGFMLGSFNGGDASYSSAYHQMTSSRNKINQILDYVEQEYVDSTDREHLVDETIQMMLQKLDPHSYYISASELERMSEPLEGSFEGIGIQFSIQKDTIVVITPISGGPSEKKGIMAGDRIVGVDTVPVAGVNISNSRVMKLLKGKGGTQVDLQIKRPGMDELIEVEIIRDKIPIYSVDVGYMIDDNTAYIKISRFSKTTYEEFVDISRHLLRQGMENLVLDLRNNGGGFMDGAINIADEFLPEDKLIVYTEGRARSAQKYFATDRGSLEDVGLVVLIDEGSASASEILAGAIQDNDRGTIMGRRSFGKGLVQEQRKWADGSASRLTIARYYTPTGRCIQKPYGENQDEYHEDYYSRMESGELNDSTVFEFNDSLKFTTPGGKVVYGGGASCPIVLFLLTLQVQVCI